MFRLGVVLQAGGQAALCRGDGEHVTATCCRVGVSYQTTDEVNNLQIIYVVLSDQLHLTEAKPRSKVNSHSWNALQHDRVVESHPCTLLPLQPRASISLRGPHGVA
jgi:hypothetical protein